MKYPLILILFIVSCGSNKNGKKVSEKFAVKIVSVENGTVKLVCTEGCEWKELSWTKNNYRSQAIDAYGMVTNKNEAPNLKDKLPDFLIDIQPTDNGANLEGLRGTEWNRLSFACSGDCNQIVDNKGLVK